MTLKSLGALAACVTLTLAVASSPAAQDAQAEKTLIANERAINEAIVKGDLATFKQHVAADAWSMEGMTGRMPVAEFIKAFPQMTKEAKIEAWDISDLKTVWVDSNTGVLTYKWTGKGTYQGKPIPSPLWASTV